MVQSRDPWKPVHALIGRMLEGRYLVASFIREGGMAQVFCGAQEAEPRHVAIKVMHPDLAGDPEVAARFLREAQLVSRLDHPNIVRTLAIGEEDDLLYIVMELVFGDDLAEPIKAGGYFSEARAAEIAIDIARAVGHAHERGIIHRDIKPENVMLARRSGTLEEDAPEVVKVLDFGIAKLFDDQSNAPLSGDEGVTSARSALTRVGAMIGTPAYMSPEQGRADTIDTRTDLYSVGVLLYEMVTGELPFSGETAMQIISRHVNDPPRPPSAIRPIHPGLERVILKALEKQPARRFQTGAEMADALAVLLPQLSRIVGTTAASAETWLEGTDAAPSGSARNPATTTWSSTAAALRVRALAESATLRSAAEPPPPAGAGRKRRPPAEVAAVTAEPEDAPTLRRDSAEALRAVGLRPAEGAPPGSAAPAELQAWLAAPQHPSIHGGPLPAHAASPDFDPLRGRAAGRTDLSEVSPMRPNTGPHPFAAPAPMRPNTGPHPLSAPAPMRPNTGPHPLGAPAPMRPNTGPHPLSAPAPMRPHNGPQPLSAPVPMLPNLHARAVDEPSPPRPAAFAEANPAQRPPEASPDARRASAAPMANGLAPGQNLAQGPVLERAPNRAEPTDRRPAVAAPSPAALAAEEASRAQTEQLTRLVKLLAGMVALCVAGILVLGVLLLTR